ncbi:MAG: UDP-glucose 4-epimerase GalE [Oscillospiraceae bacterium]|jgi:UDP-glucose 4-epimerase|nr:UDP-glucose 4-epimerase GalE [Oscillospiraceae bacterium]
MKKILVTGGAGFIGSHTCVELINARYEPVVIDNFCNCSPENIKGIEKITGKKLIVYERDVRDNIDDIFEKENISAVIHFAGLKAVGESCEQPVRYFKNNIDSIINLIESMDKANVKSLLFSSSATVYGENNPIPFKEGFPLSTTNPYGTTKLIGEKLIEDACKYLNFKACNLRYYNPINSHESGLLPEKPLGIPTNIFPIIEQCVENDTILTIFGNDYDTPDGTCVRDFINVVDLANGHVKAIEFLETIQNGICEVINLGTGKGMSVIELIKAFEQKKNCKVKYQFGERRVGDIAAMLADVSKAKKLLNWQTERTPV